MNPTPQGKDMPVQKANLKSDVNAKVAFIEELHSRGFDSAKITRSPADITATKNGRTFYFEIKYTTQSKAYFGAATLTEWEAALHNEDCYYFVVASKRDGVWYFHEYTPTEFIEFSTIPPFKAYFNVDVNLERDVRPRGNTKSVRLTRERIEKMCNLFNSFRT